MQRRLTDLTVESVIKTIDQARFAEIISRYGLTHTGDERREKYLDLPLYFRANLRRVRAVGLDRSDKRRVLDLGCGCGYFLYVCKLLGHEAIGIDRPERDSLFIDMRELLGIEYVPHTIRYPEALPDLGRFDVVTAHMVTFNGHRVKPWGPKEWEWLLGHAPKATWHIELNQEPDGTLFPPGVRELFVRLGARINGHRVLIDRRA